MSVVGTVVCPHCRRETPGDAGLCTACGELLGRPRPDSPSPSRPLPMAEGVCRLAGPALAIADYLSRVVDAEKVFDRRATRWTLVMLVAVVFGVGFAVLGYMRDWPYWWAALVAGAGLALLAFSKFSAASEFDLPENRLACAIALLRGLHQRDQLRGDLTLDVEHKLKAEPVMGSDPANVGLKVGAAARAGSQQAQRQRWLLLDLDLDSDTHVRVAISDYSEKIEQPARGDTSGPIQKRRYSALQLAVSGGPGARRDPVLLDDIGGGESWQALVTGDTTSWLRRNPPHEEKTRFDSQGRGTTQVVSQGVAPDARTSESLLAVIDRVREAG